MAFNIYNPPLARHMFEETGKWTWVWVAVRLYIGWQWVEAGWHKLGDPKWMDGGTALKGFWERAIAVPAAPVKPLITYGWYRDFLEVLLSGEHYTWFAKLVACGEFAIGIALIVGAFVGIAAFFGATMNFNFMLAGSSSSNPVMFLGAVLLILAWKTAGHWGLDRWLLPRLGTPWNREDPPSTQQ
ncbi:MAG: DoxX family protein [bacterium]|nr:DoxX family protein [bacterium]